VYVPFVEEGSTMRRRWIAVVMGAALLGGGVLIFQRTRGPAEAKYLTTPAERGRLVARVTATGTLSARVTVQVGAQVSGRIQDILVDFNSPVKKDQVIAKIDPQLFVAAVEQAKANYVAADGNRNKARVQAVDGQRQFDRAKALRDQSLIAQADLDTAEANVQSARAAAAAADGAVSQAQAALHQAEINLRYTTILSPINGVVISRNVDVGQTVASALQAPTLFTIAEDLQKMQVDTAVGEADVGKLKPGMATTFTVDAYPNEKFKGVVRQIRNAPQTVQNVVTYDAVVDVNNADLKLKPGMTANATFVFVERDDVLRVPNAALRFRPPAEPGERAHGGGRGGGAGGGGAQAASQGRKERDAPDRRTVWVLAPNATRPTAVPIRVGVSDGSLTEVLEGALNAGDAVVTELASGVEGKPPGGGAQPSPFRGRGF
jgi:HlyD family secretion protein